MTTPLKVRIPRDAVIAFLAIAFVSIAISLSFTATVAGKALDTQVYDKVLHSMDNGDGYYLAVKGALIEKEGIAPNKVRAIRSPLTYEALQLIPANARKFVPGVALFVGSFAVYLWLRRFSILRAAIGTVFAMYFFRVEAILMPWHAELWGSIFAAVAIACIAYKKWAAAIAFIAVATCVRELYAAMFVAVLFAIPKRHWYKTLFGIAAAGAFYAVHFRLSQSVLEKSGYQPPLNGFQKFADFFVSMTMTLRIEQIIFLMPVLIAGVVALVTRFREDAAVRVAAVFASIVMLAAAFFGRDYWTVCFVPFVYSAAALIPLPPITRGPALGLWSKPKAKQGELVV